MKSRTLWVIIALFALAAAAWLLWFDQPAETDQPAADQVAETLPQEPPAPLPAREDLASFPDAEIDTLYGVIKVINWQNFSPTAEGEVKIETRIGAATILRSAGVIKTKAFFLLLPNEDGQSVRWAQVKPNSVAEFYVHQE